MQVMQYLNADCLNDSVTLEEEDTLKKTELDDILPVIFCLCIVVPTIILLILTVVCYMYHRRRGCCKYTLMHVLLHCMPCYEIVWYFLYVITSECLHHLGRE